MKEKMNFRKKLLLFSIFLFLVGMVCLPNPAMTQAPPVAYYPFDGNANDASGNGYNGVVMGGGTFTTDRFGNANNAFTSTNTSYVYIPSNAALTLGGPFTLSAWFKMDDLISAYSALISKDYATGYSIGIDSGLNGKCTVPNDQRKMRLYAGNYNDPIYFNSDFSCNTWYHAAVTYNPATGQAQLYVNGVLTDSQTMTTKPVPQANGSPLGIGKDGTYTDKFVGEIDDVRIYNYALSGDQILALVLPVTQDFNGYLSSVGEYIGATPVTPASSWQFADKFQGQIGHPITVNISYDPNQPKFSGPRYKIGSIEVHIPDMGLSAKAKSDNMQISPFVPNDFFAYINTDYNNGFDSFINSSGLPNPVAFDGAVFGPSMLATDSLPTSPLNWTFGNVHFDFVASDTAIRNVFITFSPSPPPPPTPNYTLTYTTDGHGTISGTSSQKVTSGGSGSQVTAVANPGYHFVSWSDGVTTASRTDTNVQVDISVTANFAPDTYSLNYMAGPNGWISGPGSQTVSYGLSGSEVTAVPYAGYKLVNWSPDGSTDNPRKDTNVTSNISVTANFAIDSYTLLTMAYPAGGTYSPPLQVSLKEVGAPADAIYYTTDGTDPKTSSSSSKFTDPITISDSTTLKFFAVAGESKEDVATEYYTINTELGGALSTTASSIMVNGPIGVTVTLNFGTEPVTTFKPDCITNTFFEMTGPDGQLLPSLCRIRPAYGPSDVIPITPKPVNPDDPNSAVLATYDLTCNLTDMYDPSILSSFAPGTYTIQATHSNYFEINPDLNSGGLLWTGAIASNPVQISMYAYTFIGFFNPVKNPSTLNSTKAGRTIPLKWRIADPDGWVSDPSSFVSLTSTMVDCKNFSKALSAETIETAAGSSGLQYLGRGKWRFRWQTSQSYAGQCRQLKLNLKDGTTHKANFKFANQDRDRDWDDGWPDNWRDDGRDDRHGD